MKLTDEQLAVFIKKYLEEPAWFSQKIEVFTPHGLWHDRLDAFTLGLSHQQAEVDRLTVSNDQLEAAFSQITSWCKAYPIEVFTEPDWEEVKEKLGSTLLTRVSGSNMRHVVTGIQKIIDAALAPDNATPVKEQS